VLETRSKNTSENASFAAEATDARRVVVVTDRYHALRCRNLFRRHFEEVAVVGCGGSLPTRGFGSVREVVAWGLLVAGR